MPQFILTLTYIDTYIQISKYDFNGFFKKILLEIVLKFKSVGKTPPYTKTKKFYLIFDYLILDIFF